MSIRLGVFAGLYLLMSVWEWHADPARTKLSRGHWHSNLVLGLFNTALGRLIAPSLALLVQQCALPAPGQLLQAELLPRWSQFVLTVLAFDLAIYFQHRLLHKIPSLWRLHRVHHTDTALKVSTALRFHPGEILLSLAFKVGLVVALTPPPEAVLLFEILLSSGALFTHTQAALPERWESRLRPWLITPSLHRVHHSSRPRDFQRNYGTLLAVWDRAFGSYRALSAPELKALQMGLTEYRSPPEQRFRQLLRQPFQSANRA